MERAVAEVIARRMNAEGRAWPGYQRIADEAGVSPRAVQKAVKVLVDGDSARELLPLYTRKRRRSETGKPKSYEYQLVDRPEALVKERLEAAAQRGRIEAVLTGAVAAKDLEVDQTVQAVAEDLRRREIDLQSQLFKGQITEKEFKRREKAIKTQRQMLARTVAAKDKE